MWFVRWTLVLALVIAPSSVLAEPSPARNLAGAGDEALLAGPLDRAKVVRVAIARSPGLRGSKARAGAMRLMGEAEGKMPAPEAEVTVWQVPLSRPYSVADANMIMFGVRQPIPAPGTLSARAEARTREAEVEDAMVAERVRELTREVEHALVDYAEASARYRAHGEHKTAADRIVAVARARYASGGSLTEVTQAEVESARIEADLAQELAKIEAARARLNGLLIRAHDARLGPPAEAPAETVGEPLAALIASARSLRPELRTAQARHAAREAEARVAEREAAWPMFSVGAQYFAPTNNMPVHGYGVSVGASLPWLWGKARAQLKAERQTASAVQHDIQESAARIDAEVATNAASVAAASRRYEVLQERTLPAAQRGWQAAAAGYESGRTDILTLLMARTSIAEVEVDLVEARSMVDHALVDLEWAVGRPVKRAAMARKP